jgi:hypothetical protein
MNLAGIADYEPGFPFRNLMWGARQWETRAIGGGGPWNTDKIAAFQLDADGYPTASPLRVGSLAVPQVPFTVLPNVRKQGRYVILHDGEGTFAGVGGTSILHAEPGRVVLHMKHQPDLIEGIAIIRSRPGNHVRNIRILALDDEKADLDRNPFLTEFLDFCRPFHCLRFMDWAATNGSLEDEWMGRKKPTFYTMVGASGDPDGLFGPKPSDFQRLFSGGVAIEIMLQLSTLLQIDPWLCIPHRASDEYIAEYAKLTKSLVDPQRKVYLEYSNELWNWGFQQAQWMLRSRLAGELVEAKGGKAWDDKARTKGSNHPERIGALLRRAFQHWEREWAEEARTRLVRVCAVQHGWIDAARRTAKWCVQNGGADVLSPAGYFGPSDPEYKNWEARGAALSAEEVIADVHRAFQRDTTRWTKRQADLAKELSLGLVVYEGGQHIQPKNQSEWPYNPVLAAAQKHSGMYDLYVSNLRLHQIADCQLFCGYSSVSRQGTRWGSWGVKASYDEPLSDAPKLRALLDCNVPKRASATTQIP